MITLEQFLNAGQFFITEGSTYGWQCYGPDAYMLDVQQGSWNNNSATVIFNTKTKEVCEATCHDYVNNRAYRIFGNANYEQAHKQEQLSRNADPFAWDKVKFTDLEVAEDFLEKMTAIINGDEYDTHVSIPLDLDKETMFELMVRAHERNITLNAMVEEILQLAINQATELSESVSND
jgi:hypothetical protein